MLLRDLLPDLVDSGAPAPRWPTVARFVGGNDHFFLNLGMPACKLRPRPRTASRAPRSSRRWPATAPTSASRSPAPATPGSPAPADTPEGLYLGAYGPDDANPDIGDSAITETAGIGGFAMAAAPAIVRFVGGTVPDALRDHPADVRDHARREPGVRAAGRWTSAAPRPAST